MLGRTRLPNNAPHFPATTAEAQPRRNAEEPVENCSIPFSRGQSARPSHSECVDRQWHARLALAKVLASHQNFDCQWVRQLQWARAQTREPSSERVAQWWNQAQVSGKVMAPDSDSKSWPSKLHHTLSTSTSGPPELWNRGAVDGYHRPTFPKWAGSPERRSDECWDNALVREPPHRRREAQPWRCPSCTRNCKPRRVTLTEYCFREHTRRRTSQCC
mmetsp:Transcript_25082/g.65762  ORF Transcript_25082/g.65762 Transcript_25082/m.65762 type:complete len:217 (+) Transcript_25082:73-723(+)